jgi:thiol-disulfide isomerase/thioredoxin
MATTYQEWITPTSPSQRHSIVSISSIDQFNNLYSNSNETIVFLMVKATWCSHCTRLYPYIEAIAKEQRGKVLFLEVTDQGKDVDPFKESKSTLFKSLFHETKFPSLYIWNKRWNGIKYKIKRNNPIYHSQSVNVTDHGWVNRASNWLSNWMSIEINNNDNHNNNDDTGIFNGSPAFWNVQEIDNWPPQV